MELTLFDVEILVGIKIKLPITGGSQAGLTSE